MSDEPSNEADEFFVGYLDTPPRTRRFTLTVGAIMLLLGLGIATAGAAFLRGPGPGLSRERIELAGVFIQHPHPYIRYIDEEGELRTALTARQYKAGLGERYAELDGQAVTIRGRLFSRATGRILVVGGSVEATELDPAVLARLQDVESRELGEVTLRGEVVDSKCFYGQMRPGDGRAHRACAQLCIRGGIPPVFVTRDADGAETSYLLTDGDGHEVNDRVMEYLAEPVELRATLVRDGDLIFLRMHTIERL